MTTTIERQGSLYSSSSYFTARSHGVPESPFPAVTYDQAPAQDQPKVDPSSSFSKLADSLWSMTAEGATVSSDTTLKQDLAAELHKWANMDVGEKIRAQYLASRGLTEDDLASMSADDRKAIEDEIKKAIKEASGTSQAEQQIAMQIQTDSGQDLAGQTDDHGAAQPDDREKDTGHTKTHKI